MPPGCLPRRRPSAANTRQYPSPGWPPTDVRPDRYSCAGLSAETVYLRGWTVWPRARRVAAGGSAVWIEALEWPKEGNARVAYRVFADPDIYHAELDRTFLRPRWQYRALATQLPEPGRCHETFR